MLTTEPFSPETLQATLAQRPEWFKLGDAYAAAIAYELTWLAGYLRERAPRQALLVVLGITSRRRMSAGITRPGMCRCMSSAATWRCLPPW
ncbi:MAG: hypothetical protein R3F37_12450 [Candidatus Competibacteraceae bacterium]